MSTTRPVKARLSSVESAHIADLIRLGEETNLSPWSAQNYLDEIKDPNSVMYRLVSDENQTIGFVVGRLVGGSDVKSRTDAEIYNIAVTESCWGEGLGQGLLDTFVAECRRRGVDSVWLEVRESNHRAIDFYRKNGFQQVQTRSNFYANPRENGILMRLELSGQKS